MVSLFGKAEGTEHSFYILDRCNPEDCADINKGVIRSLFRTAIVLLRVYAIGDNNCFFGFAAQFDLELSGVLEQRGDFIRILIAADSNFSELLNPEVFIDSPNPISIDVAREETMKQVDKARTEAAKQIDRRQFKRQEGLSAFV